jgi:DNA-binding NtrC family response regulator
MLVIERGRRIDSNDIRKYLKDNRDDNRNLPVFTNKSLDQAERELIIRALLEMKSDIIDIKNILNQRRVTSVDSHVVEASFDTTNLEENNSHVEPVDAMERRAIIGALERFKGNRRLASKALNISERTLYRKIKEYKLDQ